MLLNEDGEEEDEQEETSVYIPRQTVSALMTLNAPMMYFQTLQ